ncbi:MAG: NADH-quinone oxidoreductase subunit J [Candidatus Accumulibacter sp.]|jgi:NADH-quinone oxidoreductase subunit J|nr:NADH-quinone oxidoreductase subunit J [Accumulibacter sp.]
MEFKTFVFYFLAMTLIYAAARVVTLRNPVHAALHLVLAFFSASGVWMLLEAEFLAVALVFVYVGSVAVLFLFVVMMFDVGADHLREGFRKNLPVAALVASLMLIEMGCTLWLRFSTSAERALPHAGAGYSNVKVVGRLLFTQYAYPFELASVVLLTGVVAAVALTLRGRRAGRSANPSEQTLVNPRDRIRVVEMRLDRPGAENDLKGGE